MILERIGRDEGLAGVLVGTVIDNLAFLLQFFDVLVQTEFADGTDSRGAYFKGNPFACFRHEEFFGLKVWVETSFRLAIGVRNVITRDGLFAREVTYFWHNKKVSVLVEKNMVFKK
jgi:hypothetical protein